MAPNPPVITAPFGGQDFTTNAFEHVMTGTAEAGVIQVYVNGSAFNVDYDLSTFEWSYNVSSLVDGANTFEVVSFDGTSFSAATTIVISFYPADSLEAIPIAPTGISTQSYIDKIDVMVTRPLNVDAASLPVGYNFYYSTQSGLSFRKLNETPVEIPSVILPGTLEILEEQLPEAQVTDYENLTGDFTIESRLVTDVTQEVGSFVYSHTAESPIPLQLNSLAYYYITAVYLDTNTNTLVESAPSIELVTQAISVDQTVRGLPPVSRADIATDYISWVIDTDPEIDVIPGTTTRDIYIEPFANEAEKMRFLIDFNSRSNSFITLIALDDADGDGVSDPVASSEYKRKLKIAMGSFDDATVQRVIDEAFEKLANNYNVGRLTASTARGSVTLSTANLRSDVIVQRGAVFSTEADFDAGNFATFFTADIGLSMLLENSADFYNPATGRFELTIPVSAQTPGRGGNVEAGTINTIVSGVTGIVDVTNQLSARFGEDEESNISLAERGLLALVGVDSGTKGGYLFNALQISGVQSVEVVSSGDVEMVRDLVFVDNAWRHVWGTVDVYVQGEGLTEATDSFAFSNPEIEAERFSVESTALLQFGALNTDITADSPIYEVTSVRNLTRSGQSYDLTGYSIIGGAVIDLDESLPTNQTIGICDTDIIRVDYKYRRTGVLVFSKQPVDSVLEITGDLSGDLQNNFNLIRTSHPLFLGRSTRAGDYLELFYDNNKPVAGTQSTTDTISMIEEFPVSLSKVGVLNSSIVVTSEDTLITYVENVDYELLLPTTITPQTRVRRKKEGSIVNGSIAKVTYNHSENFTVKYSYEQVPTRVLDFYEQTKHIDADVVVKSTLKSAIDIDAVVVKRASYNASVVDVNVRKSIARFISALRNGDAVHESDIFRYMDASDGVDFVINPLNKLSKADNTLVLDEQLPQTGWELLQNDVVRSYITTDPVLQFQTLDKGARDFTLNGGPGYERRIVGVREGNMFYPQVETEFEVSRIPGSSYIRSDGRIVVSFVNEETNFTTTLAPDTRDLYATYYAYNETGARSIFSARNELLTLGTLNLRVIDLGQQG